MKHGAAGPPAEPGGIHRDVSLPSVAPDHQACPATELKIRSDPECQFLTGGRDIRNVEAWKWTGKCEGLRLPLVLEISEEMGPVFPQWAAECDARLLVRVRQYTIDN